MFHTPLPPPLLATPRRWPQVTLRTYMVAVVLIATLPLALLTSFRIVADGKHDREVMLSNLRSSARAVARVVEREMAASRDALGGLGQADTLNRGDLAGFESRLRSRGPLRSSWSRLALLSAEGRLLFEVEGSADRSSAPTAPTEIAALFKAMAAQPAGSVLLSVHDGVPAARRGTWIGMPAQTADGARYLLAARVGLAEWQSLLEGSAPEGRGYVTLFDAQHRVLARTQEPERFVGKSLPASAVAGMGSAPSGSQRTEKLGTGETYVAWHMLRDADWGVGVGIALADFESAQVRAMLWTLGVSALCLLLGVGLSLRVARRVAEPLQRLLQYRREDAAREPIVVTEIARLRDAFELSEHERDVLMTREQLARREAETASHAKDELLAILGHELRNPLNAIVTSVEVMRSAPPGSDIAKSAHAVLTRQSHKLALMIDDLTDVGQVMADEATLALQPLELRSLVRAAAREALPRAQKRQQRLTLSAGLAVWVRGDARRIGQVMSHLLDNAIRHTPPGGAIDVSLSVLDGHAAVRVEDSGPGIDARLMPRMFEPFVQGQRGLDRASGGMGIGLALVKRLVEMHGGTVWADSSAQGSGFEWRVPVIDAPAEAGPDSAGLAARDRAAATAAAAAGAPRRIGVVEDNPDALASLRSMLELAGHQVSTASDGPDGVTMLLAERPDVALVDIGLPGLDGYEVVRRCRAAGYAGRMIAVTGYGQPEDRRRSAAEGFDAHLVKPIDPDQLLAMLRDS